MADSRLRFRIWIAGQLAGEQWIDTAEPGARQATDELKARHLAMAAAADDAGELWLVEIHDPDVAEEVAFMRFGTDRAGMAAPVPLAPGPDGPGRPSDQI